MKIEPTASFADHAVHAHQESRGQASHLAASFGADVWARVERLIRMYPIPLLAVGFGIGYLVGREIKR
jgi:hypothetical protein